MRNYRDRIVIESERLSDSVKQVSLFIDLVDSGDVSVTDRQGEILVDQIKGISEHLDVLRLRMKLVCKVGDLESVA